MRATVLVAAALLVAAIGGVGTLAWTAFSRSSGKARDGTQATRADDRAAPAHRGSSRSDRPMRVIDMPPITPGDDDERGGPEATRGAGNPVRGGPRSGVSGLEQPGGSVEPGAAAGPGAASPRSALGAGSFPPAPLQKGSACPAWMAEVGSYCIDTTEVTNVMYGAFLAAKVPPATQPAACTWNVDYTPSGGPPASDTRPVVGVSWCDAWLYCAWSGKRLCGHAGDGGNNPPASFTDASASEWYGVCTNGGTSAFAYGNAYDSAKCAHAGEDGGPYVHASSIPSCVGTTPPYDAVFDMSGNVGEWEGSCSGERGAGDSCRVRGGGPPGSSEGSCAMDELARRDHASQTVGFRCCAGRGPT